MQAFSVLYFFPVNKGKQSFFDEKLADESCAL